MSGRELVVLAEAAEADGRGSGAAGDPAETGDGTEGSEEAAVASTGAVELSAVSVDGAPSERPSTPDGGGDAADVRRIPSAEDPNGEQRSETGLCAGEEDALEDDEVAEGPAKEPPALQSDTDGEDSRGETDGGATKEAAAVAELAPKEATETAPAVSADSVKEPKFSLKGDGIILVLLAFVPCIPCLRFASPQRTLCSVGSGSLFGTDLFRSL